MGVGLYVQPWLLQGFGSAGTCVSLIPFMYVRITIIIYTSRVNPWIMEQ